MPASTVGNLKHSPAPAKTRLKCLLVCTGGKSRNPGLSRQLQMFQRPVCFIWGQPAEPHHGQENSIYSIFHRRSIMVPENSVCSRFLDGKLDQPTKKVSLPQRESEWEKGRKSKERMREVGDTASSHQKATACPKTQQQSLR